MRCSWVLGESLLHLDCALRLEKCGCVDRQVAAQSVKPFAASTTEAVGYLSKIEQEGDHGNAVSLVSGAAG